MNIIIIGYGYVGKAFEAFFMLKHNVIIYDIETKTSDRYVSEIKKSDIYVVCVPTNKNPNGSVDLSCVESVFTKIYDCDKNAFVLLKSTVPPTTTENLQKKYSEMHIVFSPEYVGESSYYLGNPYDWSNNVVRTPFFIFGGNKTDTSAMVSIFQEIAGPNKQYFQTTTREAEIVKYMENTFFASKIIFCNEFYNICKIYGADYNTVRELWLADIRINKNHTLIFNQDKPYCFGGKCLPKDLAGIIFHTEKMGYSPNFLKAVQKNNIKNSNIFMFHRIVFDSSNISPIYFARQLCTTIYELEDLIRYKLKAGKKFGSIEQCLENSDKYFLLSFDDGYKEHLDTAEYLKKKFNIPQYSLLFSISTDFMQGNSYAMDNLYALVAKKQLKAAFDFFKIDFDETKSTIEHINILKEFYITYPREILIEFSKYIGLNLNQELFLDCEGVKELSKIGVICSHGMSHRNLIYHHNESIEEIKRSKKILQDISQQEIDIFCYPEGKHNSDLISVVKENYKYALAINGTNDFYSIARMHD
ncbi:polysaccharide deacetylase family protein [Treponema pedis]|uniref:polysaccharide deacetylase family protein n=1 Tax=Treponema pedis TaxID=409322 RepID=UPI000402A1C5|nr:polysaccharide deacetylase family protein [Treponema pedis]